MRLLTVEFWVWQWMFVSLLVTSAWSLGIRQDHSFVSSEHVYKQKGLLLPMSVRTKATSWTVTQKVSHMTCLGLVQTSSPRQNKSNSSSAIVHQSTFYWLYSFPAYHWAMSVYINIYVTFPSAPLRHCDTPLYPCHDWVEFCLYRTFSTALW